MKKPSICAVITGPDYTEVEAVAPHVQLYEVRIDLIGPDWPAVARKLKHPWLATNRRNDEGGRWAGDEPSRIEELYKASEMGAAIVDIELATTNLSSTVARIKKKSKCLVSRHDLSGTPPLAELTSIVERERQAGADIGKVVTTAKSVEDNLRVLQLIAGFSPRFKLISFALGPLGVLSRVLCPLVGGEFTYAALAPGKEAAPGQLTVENLRQIYGMVV